MTDEPGRRTTYESPSRHSTQNINVCIHDDSETCASCPDAHIKRDLIVCNHDDSEHCAFCDGDTELWLSEEDDRYPNRGPVSSDTNSEITSQVLCVLPVPRYQNDGREYQLDLLHPPFEKSGYAPRHAQ
ncbi:hypothetical protein OCU04_009300 [Sclerotinia nivalis]|uniref:Uncharacterized protein n=1 Tax=Sclerotinia nivalis TaxID=352851 RepID=A0A9X0DGE3_9HELO|nr:hypothetical protein OCU04_009300 [Sclerotinia nivalis]